MGAPWNDLNGKLEEALVSVVNGLGLDASITVNAGLTPDDLALPYVVCTATGSGDEVVRGTGIFPVTATITVASSADDTALADHRARVATVFDGFLSDTISATLSAAVDDFHCFDVFFRSLPAEEVDRQLRNMLEIEAVICGVNIS